MSHYVNIQKCVQSKRKICRILVSELKNEKATARKAARKFFTEDVKNLIHFKKEDVMQTENIVLMSRNTFLIIGEEAIIFNITDDL